MSEHEDVLYGLCRVQAALVGLLERLAPAPTPPSASVEEMQRAFGGNNATARMGEAMSQAMAQQTEDMILYGPDGKPKMPPHPRHEIGFVPSDGFVCEKCGAPGLVNTDYRLWRCSAGCCPGGRLKRPPVRVSRPVAPVPTVPEMPYCPICGENRKMDTGSTPDGPGWFCDSCQRGGHFKDGKPVAKPEDLGLDPEGKKPPAAPVAGPLEAPAVGMLLLACPSCGSDTLTPDGRDRWRCLMAACRAEGRLVALMGNNSRELANSDNRAPTA